jgi:hypothetical protein
MTLIRPSWSMFGVMPNIPRKAVAAATNGSALVGVFAHSRSCVPPGGVIAVRGQGLRAIVPDEERARDRDQLRGAALGRGPLLGVTVCTPQPRRTPACRMHHRGLRAACHRNRSPSAWPLSRSFGLRTAHCHQRPVSARPVALIVRPPHGPLSSSFGLRTACRPDRSASARPIVIIVRSPHGSSP